MCRQLHGGARDVGVAGAVPLDGEPIKTLRDVVLYIDKIGARRQAARVWHHLAELLLDAAENNGAIDAVHQQLRFALQLDGKLEVRRTARRHNEGMIDA